MATVTKHVVPPPPPPTPKVTYTIELSQEEAQGLRDLLGHCTSPAMINGHIYQLYLKLNEADVQFSGNSPYRSANGARLVIETNK